MCGCNEVPGRERDYKKEELLRENMSLIPEKEYRRVTGKSNSIGGYDDYDYGFSLHVSPADDDVEHIKSHSEFVKEQSATLTPQAKARMEMHVKKHRIQLKAKEA